MSNNEKKILLDTKKANIRRQSGVDVQTIPARWRQRPDLKNFFQKDLEINLFQDGPDGRYFIEISVQSKEGN